MYKVIFSFYVGGEHFWPDPPVEYSHLHLDKPHHHNFLVTIEMSEDRAREIEFIMARQYAEATALKLIDHGAIPYSCEEIAEYIATELSKLYKVNEIKIIVMEDALVGASYDWHR